MLWLPKPMMPMFTRLLGEWAPSTDEGTMYGAATRAEAAVAAPLRNCRRDERIWSGRLETMRFILTPLEWTWAWTGAGSKGVGMPESRT